MSFSPLSKPSTVADILKTHGIDPKYAFGQNFLVNDKVLGKIIDCANVCSNDLVLEIGPGMGVLTIALLNAGAFVIAVEKDNDMVNILNANIKQFCPEKYDNLLIINDDALNFDFSLNKIYKENPKLADLNYKFVSNLPYSVAATIILNAFQSSDCLISATAMVQKEVADRISANIGTKAYGAYTVKLALYADLTFKFDVSPNSFFPPPRVTSSVINLIKNKNLDNLHAELACLLSDGAFMHRRKTIANSIKQYCSDNKNLQEFLNLNDEECQNMVLSAFAQACGDLKCRAESLSPQKYAETARILLKK